MRRVLISAGDPSGDLILSKVILKLREYYKDIEFVGLCGPACEAAGAKPLAKASDVAVVGLVEVIKKLPLIFNVLGRMRAELPKVDSLICVDFPDFNMKLAKLARRAGKPVDYLVAPQVWAWRSGRLREYRGLLRKLYPALPFEEAIFREAGIDAEYLGHPMRDLLPPRNRREAREELGWGLDDFGICLMPGSRRSEIDRHLPLLLRAWRMREHGPDSVVGRMSPQSKPERWKGVIALAPGWDEGRLRQNLSPADQSILDGGLKSGRLCFTTESRQALMAADFGWITSGTATLEAAYYQLPHILIYKLSGLSAWIIRQMTGYFSRPDAYAGLPNILSEKRIIPELLQENLTPRALWLETAELLGNASELAGMRRDLRWIPKKMGDPGATERIAKSLAELWGP